MEKFRFFLLDKPQFLLYNSFVINIRIGIEVVITALTRNIVGSVTHYSLKLRCLSAFTPRATALLKTCISQFSRNLVLRLCLYNFIWRRIEVVITGLTRNFLKSWLFAPLKKPVKSGVFSGSKIKYFVVLSVSSFQKFLEEMRNYIHGELSEWSKVQHSKSSSPNGSRNAENPLTMRVSGIPSFLKQPQF